MAWCLVSGLPGDALIIAACHITWSGTYRYVWIRVDRMCALLWADSKKGSIDGRNWQRSAYVLHVKLHS
jgi:hypothetical protein